MDADLKQFNPMVSTGGGGLTRYKSAPSSYFSNFVMEYKDVSDFLRPPPPKPLSPQIDAIFAQLAAASGSSSSTHETAAAAAPVPVMKLEIQQPGEHVVTGSAVSASSSCYTPSSALPPPHPLSRTTSGANKLVMKSSVPAQVRIPVVEKHSYNNTLARHNSLPSGLFSQIDVHNVAAAYFGVGSNHRPDSSTAYSGIGNENMKQSIGSINSDDAVLDDYMINGFWNDSPSTQKLLTGVKRERAEDDFLLDGSRDLADDIKPFSNITDGQQHYPQAEEMKKSGLLSHHLSLPKSSLEMLSAMEKFLDLQDSTVPVGVRAKRGCATHPRSIAERVRRTKISERMRRLQELVPNMDKQTNTSDMLDLAVDYIKDLQHRVQLLQASRERCTC